MSHGGVTGGGESSGNGGGAASRNGGVSGGVTGGVSGGGVPMPAAWSRIRDSNY
jgi:hypothetical protein